MSDTQKPTDVRPPTEKQLAARFKPGVSGNPGGRRANKKTILKNLAQRKSKLALTTLVDLMQDPENPAGVRRDAANDVLTWAFGKPEVQATISGSLDVNHNQEIVMILQAVEKAADQGMIIEYNDVNNAPQAIEDKGISGVDQPMNGRADQ